MGRTSSIEQLPPDILEKLQALLRDPRVSQLDATHRINAILEEQGHDDRVSKSSVNRYWQRMEDAGSKLREVREVASMWIGKLGAMPQGDIGKLTNEIVRTLAFDVSLIMQRGELDADSAPAVVKMLKDLALTQQRLEIAATANVKRDAEIRRQALEDAADEVEATAKAQGLGEDQARFWREKVLGVR